MTVTARSAPWSLLGLSRSSGKATAPAAIAAMTAATMRNVFIVYFIDSRSRGGLVVERHARTLARDAIDDEGTQQEHDEGSAPNEQGFRFQRRAEAHELAIAVRHELEYGVIALSGHQHLAHLPAKIVRKLHIRIGDGFVLTDEAAKLPGYAFEARLQGLFCQLPVGIHRLPRRW